VPIVGKLKCNLAFKCLSQFIADASGLKVRSKAIEHSCDRRIIAFLSNGCKEGCPNFDHHMEQGQVKVKNRRHFILMIIMCWHRTDKQTAIEI